MNNRPATHCIHCNIPLDSSRIDISGAPDGEFACSGPCAEAAGTIFRSGLGEYYTHRSKSGAAPANAQQTPNWKTFERPAFMHQFVRESEDGSYIADLLIQGVHCAACTWLIENSLIKQPGVVSIEVNPLTTRAELRWNPAETGLANLLEKIAKLGFKPAPFTGKALQSIAEEDRRLALRRLLVAGLGMMQVSSYAIALYAGAFQGMDASMKEFLRLISLIVATPIIAYSGAPFFAGAWRSLRAGALNMDVPVALAIGSASAASIWNTFAGSGEVYFDSATMFVFFLSGTRYLEATGRRRALDLTHALAQHLPSTTTRVCAGGWEEVGVTELQSGDIVLVPPGQAFPADGILLESRARVDESMLTGESLPVTHDVGDTVIAGTVNLAEVSRVQVEKTGPDTVLAQIGRLVTQAGNDKPKMVQLTDRIASVFVAAVLLAAAVAGVVWWQIDSDRAFEIVLTVLVVTCPCALALATPAAFTVATSRLARDGFLVRRPGALQALADVTHAVFDKTGTLTDNSLRLTAVTTRPDTTFEYAQQVAAAMEAHSAHPVARAFSHIGSDTEATRVVAVAGGGLQGDFAGETYRIGHHAFVAELSSSSSVPDWLLENTSSALRSDRLIFLGDQRGVLARFEITETLRQGAATLIAQLAAAGIDSTIASGDQAEAVETLAKRVGAKHWQSQMLPEDKLRRVRELQSNGERVVSIGDGINDSPVLAGADVSIAMGSGTSIAQHSSDCIWLGQQLDGLYTAFLVARKTMRIVKQNLVWALAYNMLAIPLALTGFIAPWMAALGMSLSSLLVMLNALRLGTAITPAVAPETVSSCCSKKPVEIGA